MLKINVRSGTIGSRHDPYGTTTIEVKNGERAADWHSDGLGRYRLKLYAGSKAVREIEWFEPCCKWADYPMEVRNKSCLAEALFRRWVGISYRDAEAQFSDMVDPYSYYR